MLPDYPNAPKLLNDLLNAGLLTRDAVSQALTISNETGLHVITALMRLNAVPELTLYRYYGALLGISVLDQDTPDFGLLPPKFSAALECLAVNPAWLDLKGLVVLRNETAITLAFREQVSAEVVTMLERRCRSLGLQIELAVITPTLASRLHSNRSATEQLAATDDLRLLRELAEEGPTIELVNSILSQAVTRRASDIHFEPEEFEFAIRLRVDGDMQELSRHAKDRFDAVVCRVKILSGLDIAERRLPQDGRINGRVHGEAFDIRVSVLPGVLGESLVLRLLRQDRKPGRLEDLGMQSQHAQLFSKWTQLANGIVLVTGPTGSGKSTTLYTALELANDKSRKIITIEDPVEYRIKGLTQLQVNSDIGYTFASALRSILRHDPDLILVGEIRDEETARIAIQSALTGHLVLSTLHTNSAIGAITRMVDMGLEPFLIGASVRGLMAQRLVRRLCNHCAQPDASPDEAVLALMRRFGLGEHASVRRQVGCTHCADSGFLGRLALYDLVEMDAELSHQIAMGATEAQLLARLGPYGDQGLLRSGIELVARGETTLHEVMRATAGA